MSDHEAEFDSLTNEGQGPALSPSEVNIARHARFEDAERVRRDIAHSILARELMDVTWKQLRADPTRGEVAAKLFSTWSDLGRSEAIIETEYSCTSIYEDVRLAMNAQGLATFDERCLVVGRKMVEATIEYVLDCHNKDAENVEES